MTEILRRKNFKISKSKLDDYELDFEINGKLAG